MAQVIEHDWEELFTASDDPRGSGMLEYTYAGLDMCSRCHALRRMVRDSTIYKPGHWGYNTTEEPPCKEAE